MEQIEISYKVFLSSGVLISMLFLYNFESGEFELHSFFDPVSKVSILLPSVTVSTSFHFQVLNNSYTKTKLFTNDIVLLIIAPL